MYNNYSGALKISTHLDHLNHCKTASGTNWLNRWTYRVSITNTHRDYIRSLVKEGLPPPVRYSGAHLDEAARKRRLAPDLRIRAPDRQTLYPNPKTLKGLGPPTRRRRTSGQLPLSSLNLNPNPQASTPTPIVGANRLFQSPRFVLDIAGIRRPVVQLRGLEKED